MLLTCINVRHEKKQFYLAQERKVCDLYMDAYMYRFFKIDFFALTCFLSLIYIQDIPF